MGMSVEKVMAVGKTWTAILIAIAILIVALAGFGNKAHPYNVERDVKLAEFISACIEAGEPPVECSMSIGRHIDFNKR